MIGTIHYRDWRQSNPVPLDAVEIPDHALGWDKAMILDIWDPHVSVDAYGRTWIWRTFIGRTFYPELIERYFAILELDWAKIQPVDEYQKPNHLKKMLIQLDVDSGMSITKKHRWLGYIQGVLAANGLLSVSDEREFTRRIFNGD